MQITKQIIEAYEALAQKVITSDDESVGAKSLAMFLLAMIDVGVFKE